MSQWPPLNFKNEWLHAFVLELNRRSNAFCAIATQWQFKKLEANCGDGFDEGPCEGIELSLMLFDQPSTRIFICLRADLTYELKVSHHYKNIGEFRASPVHPFVAANGRFTLLDTRQVVDLLERTIRLAYLQTGEATLENSLLSE